MKTIPLTKGKVALVDDQDYERVAAYRWCASQEGRKGLKWYAIRWEYKEGRRIKIRLHRFILDVPPGTLDDRVVHHKDDDGLNCQRENLQVVATNHENMCFSPGWHRTAQVATEPFL